MFGSSFFKIAFFVSIAFALGCATTKKIAPPLTLKGSSQSLQPGDIVNTRTGKTISRQTLIDDLSEAKIIYVGETHTDIEDHQIQKEIIEGLYQQNPHLIIAMEMFPRGAQSALDQYSQGMIDDTKFLEETDWNAVWGYPFQLYRGILSWARDRQLKMVGLNAPPAIVRKIARAGVSSLSPKDREQIAAKMNFADSAHRAYVKQQYEQHLKGNIKNFESFYEAQLAWEETMAETLAEILNSTNPADRIVVLLGKGHIVHKFGVPQRTLDRVVHEYKTIIPIPVDYSDRSIDPDIADYIWVTKKSTEFKHPRMLGVMVNASAGEKGLEVMGVIPDSAADKAGIKKGDILHKLDGNAINGIEDIHKAMTQKDKTTHKLVIERRGKELELPVTFLPGKN